MPPAALPLLDRTTDPTDNGRRLPTGLLLDPLIRTQANFLNNYIPNFVDQKKKRFPRQTTAFLVDGASISSEHKHKCLSN